MFTLTQEQRTRLSELCRRYHARRLDVFGSGTRDTFDPERSDLDFVVLFEDLPPAELANAFFGLRDGLGDLFNREVDLLTQESIVNPYLLASIEQSRQSLYAA